MCEWWDYSRGFSIKGARHIKIKRITEKDRVLTAKPQGLSSTSGRAHRSSSGGSGRRGLRALEA
jgi:hypothetical protein